MNAREAWEYLRGRIDMCTDPNCQVCADNAVAREIVNEHFARLPEYPESPNLEVAR
jgi:hypothetical protein